MDQLVGFLEETLAPLYQPDEKIITRSMVNNYVKQGVLAAATGKKYRAPTWPTSWSSAP